MEAGRGGNDSGQRPSLTFGPLPKLVDGLHLQEHHPWADVLIVVALGVENPLDYPGKLFIRNSVIRFAYSKLARDLGSGLPTTSRTLVICSPLMVVR